MRSLVISVQLHACESRTLISDILKKLQATEMRCSRKLLGISYGDHITKPSGPMMTWRYGHESRSAGLTKTILQGGRKGRQKKRWENNISEWTGLKFCEAQRECKNKNTWRERVDRSPAPQRSPWLQDSRIDEGASFLSTPQTNQHLFIT